MKEEAKQPVISNAQNAETRNAAQQTGENGTQETDRASSETGSAGDKTSENGLRTSRRKARERKPASQFPDSVIKWRISGIM